MNEAKGSSDMDAAIETKQIGGHVVETKEAMINGVKVGVIEAYIATWSPDTGGRFGVPDQFVQGAFAASLQEHRERGNRQVRLKDMHGKVIGGFPIETAFEDAIGLRATGHINLETQLGREAWSLIRQGVLTDMSVGFTALDDRIQEGIRLIFKAILWEGSVVDEPANRDASILEIKSVVPFQDLPLAARASAWDSVEMAVRLDASAVERKGAFVWHDRTDPDAPSSYKLQVADVVDGKLVAVPKAIFAAAAELKGEGGGGIPAVARAGAICHLERYYAKMGLDSPFEREERQFIGVEEAKSLDEAGLSDALRRGVTFSKGAARIVTSRAGVSESKDASYGAEEIRRMLDVLDDCSRLLREGPVLGS